ncbi:MAG: sodium:calcium antiporter [Deltaproteobacteria bacterium]|nr:MAG: sodium:calcium antiporter [Deltaproteobacteria bacterium]
MWGSWLLFLVGLGGLYFGAEILVRGSAALAVSLGVRPLLVGLTVVALGTSAPEFVVSFLAAIDGAGDIALGNVVGSNISNIALIIGLVTLVFPVHFGRPVIRRDLTIMLGVSALFFLLSWNRLLSRGDGVLLSVTFLGYLLYSVYQGLHGEHSIPIPEVEAREFRRWKTIGEVLIGLAFLIGSGELLVTTSTEIARVFGVPEWLIGLTMLAVGTSLPELATSLVSVAHGHREIFIGNIVGSNIFNILFVIGPVAMLRPIHVDADYLSMEFLVMLGFTLTLFLWMQRKTHIPRYFGGGLFLGYILFIAFLGIRWLG